MLLKKRDIWGRSLQIIFTQGFSAPAKARALSAVGDSRRTTFLAGYRAAKKRGDEVGLKVFLGLEVQAEDSPFEFLVYGPDEEFIEAERAVSINSRRRSFTGLCIRTVF